MIRVPVDDNVVARCREHAAAIASDVQRYIDAHTTVGVERVVMRALGVVGVDDQGVPMVNALVDRLHGAGLLRFGASFAIGAVMARHGGDVQEAAERLAFGPIEQVKELFGEHGEPTRDAIADARRALEVPTADALARIDRAREQRGELRAKYAAQAQPGTPLKYVIVATGNIYDDAVQAKAAAQAGADIVAVIRATAQSLLD